MRLPAAQRAAIRIEGREEGSERRLQPRQRIRGIGRERAGLDRKEAADYLAGDADRERIARAEVEARNAGIGGVPFFIEEFVRSLIEEEQVTQGAAGWGPTHSERMPELPDSIFATLFSRLDRLPNTQKSLIQRASVVGDTFWESSLRFPAPALGSDAVALGQLQAQAGDVRWLGESILGRHLTCPEGPALPHPRRRTHPPRLQTRRDPKLR